MESEFGDVIRREEQRRDAVLDPADRWPMIMEAIIWLDNQPRVQRNAPARMPATAANQIG